MLKQIKVKSKIKVSSAVALAVVTIAVVSAAMYVFSASSLVTTLGSCGDNICGPFEKANPNSCPQDCGSAQPVTAFVAVHMEAGGGGLMYATNMWPKLVSLVSLADSHGFKLTLEFNPQWATYILKDQSKVTLLRSWGASGHEIALHHHGPSHSDWNGYTNREDMKSDSRYKGTVLDMMKLLKQLPTTGVILTAGATDEATDWPEGVKYDTDGGTVKTDLLSIPTAVTHNGKSVTQLRYRSYAVDSPTSAPLSEIEAAYSVASGKILGIVFHIHDYAQKQSEIETLFSSLKNNNVQVKAVKNILSTY